MKNLQISAVLRLPAVFYVQSISHVNNRSINKIDYLKGLQVTVFAKLCHISDSENTQQDHAR